MTLLRVPPPLSKAVDLKRTYDAVIVGSGAAGGMAAHVLTAHGLDVLLLEAGKQIDTTAELHSLEWPYDHPRRGEMPYDRHALRGAEYAFRKPPYAPKDASFEDLRSLVGYHTHHHHPTGSVLKRELKAYADDLKVVSVFKPSTDTNKFAERIYVDIFSV